MLLADDEGKLHLAHRYKSTNTDAIFLLYEYKRTNTDATGAIFLLY